MQFTYLWVWARDCTFHVHDCMACCGVVLRPLSGSRPRYNTALCVMRSIPLLAQHPSGWTSSPSGDGLNVTRHSAVRARKAMKTRTAIRRMRRSRLTLSSWTHLSGKYGRNVYSEQTMYLVWVPVQDQDHYSVLGLGKIRYRAKAEDIRKACMSHLRSVDMQSMCVFVCHLCIHSTSLRQTEGPAASP